MKFQKTIKSGLYRYFDRSVNEVFHRTGIYRILQDNSGYRGVILMFHRVVEQMPDDHTSLRHLMVSTDFLARVIRYFRDAGYSFATLDDMSTPVGTGSAPQVHFTFDDGYRDTYELAFPLLRENRVPFTLYISPSVPDHKFNWWHYMLEDLVWQNDIVRFPGCEEGTIVVRSDTPEKKKRAFRQLERFISRQNLDLQPDFLTDTFASLGLIAKDYQNRLSISWEQLCEMASSSLVMIGGHTLNHYPLNKLSPEDVKREITVGNQVLEEHIGRRIMHFAYPFGCPPAVGVREFAIARECGLTSCTTTGNGYVTRQFSDFPERVPRIGITEVTSLEYLDIRFRGPVDSLFRRVREGMFA